MLRANNQSTSIGIDIQHNSIY